MVFTVLQDMHEADSLFGSGVHSLVRAGSGICTFGARIEVVDLDIRHIVYDLALSGSCMQQACGGQEGKRRAGEGRKGRAGEGRKEREGRRKERQGAAREVTLFIHLPTSRSPAPEAAVLVLTFLNNAKFSEL